MTKTRIQNHLHRKEWFNWKDILRQIMCLYQQESMMDASTDPHVIRASPKYPYNIWTLDMGVAIENLDLLLRLWIIIKVSINVYKVGPKSNDLSTLLQTIKWRPHIKGLHCQKCPDLQVDAPLVILYNISVSKQIPGMLKTYPRMTKKYLFYLFEIPFTSIYIF